MLDEQIVAPALRRGLAPSVVVVMNHGLAAIAEFIFLLDHSGAIGGRTLLDDGCTVAITVAVFMGLAHRHTGRSRK